MKAFFVLIFISLKLFAFPIGDEKTMFSGKNTTIKEHQNSVLCNFLDQELTEIEESEDDSTDDTSDNAVLSIQDFFALLFNESTPNIWASSLQHLSCKLLYKLYQSFLI